MDLGGGLVLLFGCAAGDVGIAALLQGHGRRCVEMSEVDQTVDDSRRWDLVRSRDIFRQRQAARECRRRWWTRCSAALADRGSLVISGANGIVGAGKMMQLASRLEPFGVASIGLSRPRTRRRDRPAVPGAGGGRRPSDGADTDHGQHRPHDVRRQDASRRSSGKWRPRFLLEAIPEILEIKKAHYRLFREAFPGIEIRSVTSGFPSSELGVGVAHPAFPHEINKVWEVVEQETSSIDAASVGAGADPGSGQRPLVVRAGRAVLRRDAGGPDDITGHQHAFLEDRQVSPEACRAESLPGSRRRSAPRERISSPGPACTTWRRITGRCSGRRRSWCERQATGQNWYPPDHFRPAGRLADGRPGRGGVPQLDPGAIVQMVSLLLHERRAHLSAHQRDRRELCAQFRRGVLAMIRSMGAEQAIKLVEAYHRLHPAAAAGAWYPAVFEHGKPRMAAVVRQRRARREGGRHDDQPGNLQQGRGSRIEPGHRLAQGRSHRQGDRDRRFPLGHADGGRRHERVLSRLGRAAAGTPHGRTLVCTARRLHDEFKVSVGFVAGKRCLGGCLELLMHCHYLVAVEDALLGMPEVTLPVVPGMEGCHWPFRKATATTGRSSSECC